MDGDEGVLPQRMRWMMQWMVRRELREQSVQSFNAGDDDEATIGVELLELLVLRRRPHRRGARITRPNIASNLRALSQMQQGITPRLSTDDEYALC